MENELREERIKELELQVRQLHEEIAKRDQALLDKDDEIVEWREKSGRNYSEQMANRDEQIGKLNGENNALRKIHGEALAESRARRDEYDALCNELGELGVDIPKLRKGEIKVS